MAQLVLVGAGGHARVLLAALRAQGLTVAGFVGPEGAGPGWPGDVPHLGDDEHLQTLDKAQTRLVLGIGSVGPVSRRLELFERLNASGFRFASVVHPTSFADPSASAGEGLQLMARSTVQSGVVLGFNVLINTGAIVDHDCRVGNHCHIAPGAVLSGGVAVGDGVHIGAGACVIQGVQIGANAVIGAGAVVIDDVRAGAVVVGNPGRALEH